jgi:hypothetical protein
MAMLTPPYIEIVELGVPIDSVGYAPRYAIELKYTSYISSGSGYVDESLKCITLENAKRLAKELADISGATDIRLLTWTQVEETKTVDRLKEEKIELCEL